jgi:hypothetical protein
MLATVLLLSLIRYATFAAALCAALLQRRRIVASET